MDNLTVIVDSSMTNQRFDRFLRKYFRVYTQIKLGDIFAWIRKGDIKVNGKRVKENYMLIIGDEIIFGKGVVRGEKNSKKMLSQKDRKLNKIDNDVIKGWIIHEDANWLVFNKPSGIIAHPGNNHRNDISMNDYLYSYLGVEDNGKDTFKPSFGFRLDKDTSGVLIAAKNYDALQYLNKIIRDRDTSKEYCAIVVGKFPQHQKIDVPIQKSYDKKFNRSQMVIDKKGVEACTECWLQKQINHPDLGVLSLIKIKLYTGRMHQIRIHTSYVGFPVLGDMVYGIPSINRILYKRLKITKHLLHCQKYSFDDVNGKKHIFEAQLPIDFKNILNFKL